MSTKNQKARDLIEQPGFYLGPFPKGTRCTEKKCRERAFSATDDNRTRCFEHTLSYLQACASKSTTTPKELFDALTEELKRIHAQQGRHRGDPSGSGTPTRQR